MLLTTFCQQVFDLTIVKPSDFVQYVLGCLEQLADAGDHSAKSIRHNLRVMVCMHFPSFHSCKEHIIIILCFS